MGLRFLEIYHKEGNEKYLKAMHDIYADNNSETWFLKWGDCKESIDYLKTLKKESEWCINQQLNFTPVLLINGKRYPDEYDRMELIHFIDALNEQSKTEMEYV